MRRTSVLTAFLLAAVVGAFADATDRPARPASEPRREVAAAAPARAALVSAPQRSMRRGTLREGLFWARGSRRRAGGIK